MARRTKKKPKNYPLGIVFDENLDGVAQIFDLAGLNLPDIFVAVKGTRDHVLAHDLRKAVFFTGDRGWLTRQPPYDHGGIIFLDTGNLHMGEKALIIRGFLYEFHIRNKNLDSLRCRRFRLTKTGLWEVPFEGKPIKIW